MIVRAVVVFLTVAALAGCTSDAQQAPEQKHAAERAREWVRNGTKELGSDVVPANVPGRGFGPDSLPNPAARTGRRQ